MVLVLLWGAVKTYVRLIHMPCIESPFPQLFLCLSLMTWGHSVFAVVVGKVGKVLLGSLEVLTMLLMMLPLSSPASSTLPCCSC